MSKPFTALDKKLSHLLTSENPYRIPRYQRPYAWTVTHATEFWNDLVDAELVILGTFVFDEETDDGYRHIIDGQQRLTTIMVLLAALWRTYRDLSEPDRAAAIKQMIYYTNKLTLQGETPRLEANEKIRSVFNLIIDKDWDGIFPIKLTKEQKCLKEVYEFFGREIDAKIQGKERDEKLKLLLKLSESIYNAQIIEVIVHGEEMAYLLFEVLNARGEDLKVADLLKNYIFQKIAAEGSSIDEAEAKWKLIEDTIKEVERFDISKLIRYYWISKNEFVTDKYLFKAIKDKERQKSIEVKGLLDELLDVAQWIKLLARGTREEWMQALEGSPVDYKAIYSSIQGLRIFNVTQCYVLFIALLVNRHKFGFNFSDVFKRIEKFHFGYSAICNQPGNLVERKYHACAKKLNIIAVNEDSLAERRGEAQSIVADLINDLGKESYESFLISFKELSYNEKYLVRYIFARYEDFLLEFKHDPGIMDDIGLPKKQMKFNMDHIIPQDAFSAKNTPKEYKINEEQLHNIGNLILVECALNGWMSNDLPTVKIKKMSTSTLKAGNIFSGKYQNNFINTDIGTRSAELARWAYENMY